MTFYSSLMYLHHLTQHNNYTITPNITTTTCKPSSSLILYNKPFKAVPKSIKWMTFDISLEKYLQNICEARRDQTCDTWSMARGIFSEFNAVSRDHTQHHGKQKKILIIDICCLSLFLAIIYVLYVKQSLKEMQFMCLFDIFISKTEEVTILSLNIAMRTFISSAYAASFRKAHSVELMCVQNI